MVVAEPSPKQRRWGVRNLRECEAWHSMNFSLGREIAPNCLVVVLLSPPPAFIFVCWNLSSLLRRQANLCPPKSLIDCCCPFEKSPALVRTCPPPTLTHLHIKARSRAFSPHTRPPSYQSNKMINPQHSKNKNKKQISERACQAS